MRARIGEQHGHDGEGGPFVDGVDVDDVEVDEERERPELRQQAEEGQVADDFGQVGEGHHGYDAADDGGDDEQIRREGAESEALEG